MLIIEAYHLYKTYQHTIAVADVDLAIGAGEIFGLMGPDGAGKTTSIRLLCGAVRPDAGHHTTIQVAGYNVLKQTEQARAQIGYLPQRFSLYEDLTVMENLRFFAEVRGLSSAEWRPRCMEILKFVGLAAFTNRRAGFLSGGMKQKLGLAAALVHRPRVLLLDEPTTGVDPVTRQDFWQLIIRLVSETGDAVQQPVVLVSTPYMDEAARCTCVGFMRQGRLIVTGTPAELRASLPDTILELAGQPLPALRQIADAMRQAEAEISGIMDVQMFGDCLHIRVKSQHAQFTMEQLQQRAAEQGILITRLRSIPTQLEDVFMSLMQEES